MRILSSQRLKLKKCLSRTNACSGGHEPSMQCAKRSTPTYATTRKMGPKLTYLIHIPRSRSGSRRHSLSEDIAIIMCMIFSILALLVKVYKQGLKTRET